MLKLDPVTGRQTLTDTLTDAAYTSQLKSYLKWISAYHIWRMSPQGVYYKPSIIYVVWFSWVT